MLIAAKSTDTKELFQKISDLETSLLEKEFENKAIKEKQESGQKRLEKIKTEYDNLSAQFADNTKNDALKLQVMKTTQSSRVNAASEQEVQLVKKDLELEKANVRQAQQEVMGKAKQIEDLKAAHQNEIGHLKAKMERQIEDQVEGEKHAIQL